jgi:hypothetical protein
MTEYLDSLVDCAVLSTSVCRKIVRCGKKSVFFYNPFHENVKENVAAHSAAAGERRD